MSESSIFGSYVEALNALSTLEDRQRAALRKAIEAATRAEDQAKVRMADQQRMYDRAIDEARDAEQLLADLRSTLGVSHPASAAPQPPRGAPQQLIQIRAQIRDVAEWATDAKPTAESLLRTRERLAKAAPKLVNPGIAPVPLAPASPQRIRQIGVIAAFVVLIVGVIVLVVLIAQ